MKQCLVEKCERLAIKKKMCSAHYNRKYVHGWSDQKLSLPFRKKEKQKGSFCLICNKPSVSKNLCLNHSYNYRKHNLPLNIYVSILVNASCEICGTKKDLVLDHDHSICNEKQVCQKCFRGVLCRIHNSALGIVNDDPEILKLLLKYIS
jgi:hypothetical protein